MKRVLVLDDDTSVLEVVEEALTYSDYEVKTTVCSNELLALIGDYKPNLILIDYILNGINGGEICHQIKMNPATAQIPVIIVSAYPKVLLSLGDYGCDAMISKPFSLQDLLDKVETCICAKH